jgi:hypothetical protein
MHEPILVLPIMGCFTRDVSSFSKTKQLSIKLINVLISFVYGALIRNTVVT